MIRLTREAKNDETYDLDCMTCEGEYYPLGNIVDIVDKLGEIEDLGEQLGCPLDIVGRLLLHKERYMYTIEKSKLTGEDFMDKHKIVGVSEFGVCILITNYILKTEPKYYEWNQYGKTWWLKKDKSE